MMDESFFYKASAHFMIKVPRIFVQTKHCFNSSLHFARSRHTFKVYKRLV